MITLEHINKSFGDNHVLKDVSIAVPEGGVTALIGASGSGKSTLLRCVNLLEIPQSGEVHIDDTVARLVPGHKVSRDIILALRRKTGMVFQNFQLFPHLTALENVMEGLVTVLKWPREKAETRARDLLHKVGMSIKADAWPSSLSGGQQQRVAIARALAPSPKVLLCDEPTSALDPQLAAEVVDVLADLARQPLGEFQLDHGRHQPVGLIRKMSGDRLAGRGADQPFDPGRSVDEDHQVRSERSR